MPLLLNRMGMMGIQWDELPSPMRSAIDKECLRCINNMIPKGIAGTLRGLSQMNCHWSSLSNEFRHAINESIASQFDRNELSPENDGFAIASTLYSLGKMEATIDDLSTATKQTLIDDIILCCNNFNNIQLQDVIYG